MPADLNTVNYEPACPARAEGYAALIWTHEVGEHGAAAGPESVG